MTKARGQLPGGAHVVLRVRVPDRPGGLGAVASRLGAVGADITDVVVARRGGGTAIDVFHLTLPETATDLMALLEQELVEVDGADIESWATASCCGTPDAAGATIGLRPRRPR